MAKRVIYVHGFNSSGLSAKAQQFGRWLREQKLQCEYITPCLHFDPRVAIHQLDALIDDNTGLLGSSLGGFYATYLSQTHKIPAVVINPAVRPFELLADYLGPQYNPYQQVHYTLGMQHVQALQLLYLAELEKPQLLLLLQQMGDEVLPFQQALEYYKSCQQRIDFAGDHSFMDFHRYFDTVVNFLKIT